MLVRIQALLLDIEGTTTPISFVYDIFFPYVRAQVEEFLTKQHTNPEVQTDLALLREEHRRDVAQGNEPRPWDETQLESIVGYVHWLMDRDRKATGLKSLQGKIWQRGYEIGVLRSQVFPDVSGAFARWKQKGKKIAIFSSGSVLAQRLLFAHTNAGNLTGYITAYFDTTTGPKTEQASYERIGAALGLAPQEILFVSDAVAELDAARSAGLETAHCLRPGNPSLASGTHPVVCTFEEVLP